MFDRYESRRRKAERIAGQAWDQLSAAVESAESSTRRQYADTSKKISDGTKEARQRGSRSRYGPVGDQPSASITTRHPAPILLAQTRPPWPRPFVLTPRQG